MNSSVSQRRLFQASPASVTKDDHHSLSARKSGFKINCRLVFREFTRDGRTEL